MTVYVLYYIAIIVLSLCSKKNIINVKTFAIISGVLLTALIALRSPSMGADLGTETTMGYLNSFHALGEKSWSSIMANRTYLNYEFGYIILNKLLYTFSTNIELLIIVCGIVSIAPAFVLFHKESKDLLMSIVIYLSLPLFLITFSGLRQAISLGICYASYIFIKKRKWFPFILLVVFAFLFHKSAIVFLFAYPIYSIKLNVKRLPLCLIVLGAIAVLRYYIFKLLCIIFGYNVTVDNNGAFLFSVFLILLFVFVVLCGEEDHWSTLLYVACIVQLFSIYSSIVMRAGYYYLMALTLALPDGIGRIKDKKAKLFFRLIIIIFFIVYGYYAISTSKWAEANPYSFFWQER